MMKYQYSHPRAYVPLHRRWPDAKMPGAVTLCAVDLRDGNQALPVPMHVKQKLQYFQMLCAMGFREIEVGFPAASADEWEMCRQLIASDKIPEDVTISVLMQAREHVIRRTFEALAGVKNVICHLYIPTSDLHVKYVLGINREELKQLLYDSVALVRQLADGLREANVRLEFSPEEFTDSDLDFVVELCRGVLERWHPADGERVILNLPCTVERGLPMHYADMLEAFQERIGEDMKQVELSIHPHNDMGCAVASGEMGILAGATRVEGTLFGHGERAGNLDLVTLALNLGYLGVETGIDLSHLENVSAEVSRLTSMPVPPRQPYSGALVFTSFSGSHQDAIYKCQANAAHLSAEFGGWKLPYYPVAPEEMGRSFQRDIRLTSQSGKGGVAYVLESSYGVQLPGELLAELSKLVKRETEHTGFEATPDRVWDIFLGEYLCQGAPLRLLNYWPRPDSHDPNRIEGEVHVQFNGVSHVLCQVGNGPVAAFANALRQLGIPAFQLLKYEERSIGTTVNAEAITIVSMLRQETGKLYYGVGFGANIVQGAARAIISSLNRMLR